MVKVTPKSKGSEAQYDAMRKSDLAFDKYIKKLMMKEKSNKNGKTENSSKNRCDQDHNKTRVDPGKQLIKSPSEAMLYTPALKQLTLGLPTNENSLINRFLLNKEQSLENGCSPKLTEHQPKRRVNLITHKLLVQEIVKIRVE